MLTNIDITYLEDLIKRISWEYDSIFTEAHKDILRETVDLPKHEVHNIINYGLTKETATYTGNKYTMWQKLSASQTKKEKKIVHYFTEIYKKIACCIGVEDINVKLYRYNPESKKLEIINVPIVIDRDTDCIFSGINYRDDNDEPEDYNENCERFMKRFIAFLTIYDPDNPMIETYGGCISNTFIPENIKRNPMLYKLINSNRYSSVRACQNYLSYKRKQDRKIQNNTICLAEFNVQDVNAGGNAGLESNIIQNCGGTSSVEKNVNNDNDYDDYDDYDDDNNNNNNNNNGTVPSAGASRVSPDRQACTASRSSALCSPAPRV